MIPKHVEGLVCTLAENHIFDSEKTALIAKFELVFSESNLWFSALTNFQFPNVVGYRILYR